MTVQTYQGSHPHIEWIDLRSDGILTECAIVKKDAQGSIYFFEVASLDSVDKRRLARIVSNKNAKSFPLYELMAGITLNNGMNALEYFHQLVKIITPNGKVIKPQQGVVGAPVVRAPVKRQAAK